MADTIEQLYKDEELTDKLYPVTKESAVKDTNNVALDTKLSAMSSAMVKSVNSTLPDSNGNVDVNGALPTGGTQGQVLTKQSSTTGDVAWEDIDALPSGGTTGQALIKQSSQDGDADWEDIPSDATKMDLVSSPTSGDLLTTNSSGQATDSGSTIASVQNDVKCLVLTSSSFSSLPKTITNANITSDHVVVNSVLSNPSAQTGDWTVTTNNGSLTISGSISGSTTVTLYLVKQRS